MISIKYEVEADTNDWVLTELIIIHFAIDSSATFDRDITILKQSTTHNRMQTIFKQIIKKYILLIVVFVEKRIVHTVSEHFLKDFESEL